MIEIKPSCLLSWDHLKNIFISISVLTTNIEAVTDLFVNLASFFSDSTEVILKNPTPEAGAVVQQAGHLPCMQLTRGQSPSTIYGPLSFTRNGPGARNKL